MNEIKRKGKRANLSAIFFLTLLPVLLLGLGSCKKEVSDLGLGVQPEEDLLSSLWTDTFTINSFSVKEDSLRTDELSAVMLGNYYHPDFGQFNASFYTQLNISSANFSPAAGFAVDSVVLQLVYTGSYGQKDAQQFEVYKLSEDMYKDTNYYSNTSLTYDLNNLAPPVPNYFAPNTTDSVTIGTEKIKPHMRIHLSPTFGNYLLTSGHLLSAEDFKLNACQGLYIRSSTLQGSKSGGVYYFNITDAQSKMVVYYHDNNDTTRYDFTLGESEARFTHIDIDRSGSSAEMELADSTLGNAYYYIQAGAGLAAEIHIPSLPHFGENENLIINKAELVMPAQFYTIDPYTPPQRIFVFPLKADGTYEVTVDQAIDPLLTTYGGSYVDSKKAYVFNITRYIQSVVKGEKENYGLRVAVGASSITANAAILNGRNSFNRGKPYLRLTYTKYQ